MKDSLEKLRREVAIHGGLDHPNIVKCHEAFESNNSLYIVMELCTGGELYDRIAAKKKFSEVEARHVFKQIVEGVKYLHDHKIAHCDLKPDNILYLDKSPDSPLKLIGQPEKFSSLTPCILVSVALRSFPVCVSVSLSLYNIIYNVF